MTIGTRERLLRMEDQGALNVTMDSIPLEESSDGCEYLLGVTVQCNLQ